MLVLKKGLKFLWFIDGEYVAHDVTPPSHVPDRHHNGSLLELLQSLKLASILPGQLFRQILPNGQSCNFD